MVGHPRQENILYKCAKLHDHSSNRKLFHKLMLFKQKVIARETR